MITRFSLFTLLVGLALAAEPKQVVWSKEAFGPDGPWNAVEVSFGSQPNIAIFPGRRFNTYVTTSDYCAFNNSVPHCVSGTYLKDDVVADDKTIRYTPDTQGVTAGIEARGTANMYLEDIEMQFASGTATVKNHSITLIEDSSQVFVYPDGTFYPIFTGCLSIGATDSQQVFTRGDGEPTINASMIPWALESSGETPSSSFGLHYGSAGVTARMPGSLVFGGYDRNRVIGPILSLEADFGKPTTLQDISLHVIKGASPFPPSTTGNTGNTAAPTTIPNLLRSQDSANDDATANLPITLDPCSPYLTLPKPTCDAIAAHLPVTHNASLGLYLWNTSSPRYHLLTSSASTLALTFMGASNTASPVTIHIPFPHLNLTLTPPFTDNPLPYFPCYTGGAPGGEYVLGRAFFQDVFLGADWEGGRSWLAQAPGPNIPAGVDAVGVDGGVEGGGNDWERSWEGVWRVLEEGDVEGLEGGGGSTVTGSGDGDGGEGEEAGGLSTGAMAGIGVGAAVGGALLVAAAGMIWWRRRRMGQASPQEMMASTPMHDGTTMASPVYRDQYTDHYGPKSPDPVAMGHMSEAPVQNAVFEMPGDRPGNHTSTDWTMR
ncbi:aspartic peptidase domain-containing protein [Chaetomium fimeti]|uniref:Aspartic peptidase domain-containing protein n=1 Tax=Chaetomium fimeti TaxID=1854472 RepID=A0AAE0LPV7_9PEZI|nr:aspartic peptidase domain-containing protein [Chaetomium fimeti]